MLNTKSKNLVKGFYNTFLGLLIKKGNLVSAKTLLDKTFSTILTTTKIPFNIIILKVVLLLKLKYFLYLSFGHGSFQSLLFQ